MKKIIAVLLAVLLACSAAFAVAENEKITVEFDESLSLNLRCPEGYKMEKEYINGYLFMTFTPDDEAKVHFSVIVCADDEYDDYARLNDLSEEQLQQFISDMTEGWYNPKVEVLETGYGSKIIVADEQDAEMDYVMMQAIYHGYFITTYARHADGAPVTEEEVQQVIDFHTDMDFVFSSEKDSQNPVMNLVGDYSDQNSQRATLNIQAVGEGGSTKALITVHWANSAADGVEWELPCVFDWETGIFTYENGVKKEYTATENGEITYKTTAENLTGTFEVMEDGAILWHDHGADADNGCSFVYIY